MRRTVPALVMMMGCGSDVPEELPVAFPPDCVVLSELAPFEARVGEAQTQDVTLRNTCGGPVRLIELLRDDPHGVFNVADPSTRQLAAGQQLPISVEFRAPRRGEFASQYGVSTSAGLVDMDLIGRATGPHLEFSPRHLELEPYLSGCTSTGTFQIDNSGDVVVRIVALSTSTGGWDAQASTALPIDLAPGQTLSGEVTASLTEPGQHDTNILVRTAESVYELPVEVEASAHYFGEEEFTFSPGKKNDLLVTLSRSGPSHALGEDLVQALPQWISRGRAEDADVRAAVIVGDVGCVVGAAPYVDTSFSDSAAEEAFETMADLDRTLAPYGSNEDRPMVQAATALSERNIGPGGCNQTLLREDARLHFLYVAGSTDSAHWDWHYYVDLFDALKEDSSPMHHAITPTEAARCGVRPSGLQLLQAAEATGGIVTEPCMDLHQAMDDIYDSALRPMPPEERQVLRLNTEPVVPTVEVYVDDTVTSRWTWDDDQRAVRFADHAIPEPSEVVTVKYLAQPECR